MESQLVESMRLHPKKFSEWFSGGNFVKAYYASDTIHASTAFLE